MKHILINFDIILVVVYHPFQLCFKQSYQLILSAYKLRNLSAVILKRASTDSRKPK